MKLSPATIAYLLTPVPVREITWLPPPKRHLVICRSVRAMEPLLLAMHGDLVIERQNLLMAENDG